MVINIRLPHIGRLLIVVYQAEVNVDDAAAYVHELQTCRTDLEFITTMSAFEKRVGQAAIMKFVPLDAAA